MKTWTLLTLPTLTWRVLLPLCGLIWMTKTSQTFKFKIWKSTSSPFLWEAISQILIPNFNGEFKMKVQQFQSWKNPKKIWNWALMKFNNLKLNILKKLKQGFWPRNMLILARVFWILKIAFPTPYTVQIWTAKKIRHTINICYVW